MPSERRAPHTEEHSPEGVKDQRSLVLKVPDEDHTLGTILSHAMWSNPHVVVAQYAQKHPVQREEISIYCQTDTKISAVSGIEDAVHRTQKMLHAIDEEMMRALEEYSHAG